MLAQRSITGTQASAVSVSPECVSTAVLVVVGQIPPAVNVPVTAKLSHAIGGSVTVNGRVVDRVKPGGGKSFNTTVFVSELKLQACR
ncbi:MAG: hypothetical protein IPN13_16980 [Bacteroidetes bacterium]|nr:hypothetical protein [Bacteroidota bacterium]